MNESLNLKVESPNQLQQQSDLSILDNFALLLGEEDIVFFANYFLGIQLNSFQERLLLSFSQNTYIIVVSSNQCGKTVALAVYHIWKCFYKKGFLGEAGLIEKSYYQTLNISPVSRQAKEAFRYVTEILSSSFSWEMDGKRYVNKCKLTNFITGQNENMGRIDFANNSCFFCLSVGEDQGSSLAGAQFPEITYDECVQSLHLEEELPARIFSRTAKYAGGIKLISTPDDQARSQQYWYHLCSEANREKGIWKLVRGLYDENKFIPEETREKFKKQLKEFSPEKYKQVIGGEFISSSKRMYTPEEIEGLWNGRTSGKKCEDGKKYVTVVDWGVAEGGDETVIIIADVTIPKEAEVIYTYSKTGGDPNELVSMASLFKMEYNDADLVLDTESMGGTIFRKMLAKSNPIRFDRGAKSEGLTFLKMRLRNNLLPLTRDVNCAIIGGGRIKSYYLPKLENQLAVYKVDDKKLTQDWVMVFAMLCWYLDKKLAARKIETFKLKIY